MARKRMLVAYSMSSTYTPTTVEYLKSLRKYTDFDVDYVHVTHDAIIDFDINQYDIVFNNYCARVCFQDYLSESYRNALKRFLGLKVISVQDDYDRTSYLHAQIRELGFHILITCIQPEFWELAYPKAELPGITIVQGLTGYLPDALLEKDFEKRSLDRRETKIAYRGGYINAKYGRLGHDKHEIGRQMRAICEARGIPHDIAMDSNSRLYGDDWYRFLAGSRTVLGAETGSNAFDFDGRLEYEIESLTKQLGREPSYWDIKESLDRVEQYFNVGQISPRVFECAAMNTPMILFRGNYSNSLTPGEDYIVLEKDLSNVDDVLLQLDNFEHLHDISSNAYIKLVKSGKYSYSNFARKVYESISDKYDEYISDHRKEFMKTVLMDWDTYCARENERFGHAHAERAILSERPTEWPLDASVFKEKLEALREARISMLFRANLQRYNPFARADKHSIGNKSASLNINTYKIFWKTIDIAWNITPSIMKPIIKKKLKKHVFKQL